MVRGFSSVIWRDTSSKSDCTQFWDAVADAKHPRHKEALSGVKASRARLMNEAESRRKEKIPSTFTTKKVKTLPDEVVASNLEAESSSPLRWITAWRQGQHCRMSNRT